MKKSIVVLMILMSFNENAIAETLILKYFQADNRYSYRIELLKLAMGNTLESDGPYLLEPVYEEMTQKRGLIYLEEGEKINIVFLPSNIERESKFLSVKIPILRGLLGYRVFIIRKENLEDFSNVNSLNDLKKNFTAGFGSQWADMEVLELNGIPVIGTAKYENLFKMLSAKRFDFFPRGINEAWKEISDRRDASPDLIVEPSIAIYYPYPVYYFVNKKDFQIADRIERGLNIAIKDGSFENLFLKYHSEVIRQADLKNRKLFIIENPTLEKNTEEPDTGWLEKINTEQ